MGINKLTTITCDVLDEQLVLTLVSYNRGERSPALA